MRAVVVQGGHATAWGHVRIVMSLDACNGMLMLSTIQLRLCCKIDLLNTGEA